MTKRLSNFIITLLLGVIILNAQTPETTINPDEFKEAFLFKLVKNKINPKISIIRTL